jgi:anti-sigma factor RsiW
MNGKCFEIGTIQAFLDGETSPEVSLRFADHAGGCDSCARLLADADEQNAVVFSALERELNSLVPTQRLWTRINDTIEVEKSRAPLWQKTLAYLRASLLNPSLAAAAAIVLFVGMVAIVTTNRDAGTLVADERPIRPTTTQNGEVSLPPSNTVTETADAQSTPAAVAPVKISNLKASEMRALAASVRANDRAITPQNAVYTVPAADPYLPGEESYVKTISDLKENVDSQKDAVLTPSARVSFERDMAVVEDSIQRTRDVVKKNPRNQAARQVLYSSYQDKIDLLNSVAQREELMASLK